MQPAIVKRVVLIVGGRLQSVQCLPETDAVGTLRELGPLRCMHVHLFLRFSIENDVNRVKMPYVAACYGDEETHVYDAVRRGRS